MRRKPGVMSGGADDTEPGIDDIDERYSEAIQTGDLASLQTLVAELGDFKEVGHHLVSHAVMAEDLAILRWLLSQGADPNRADPFEDGRQALFWAAFSKRSDIAEMLVEAGATVTTDEEPEGGETALHCAAENGDADLVRFLIEKGGGEAAFLMFDYCDKSPLHRAVRGDSLPAAEALLRAGHDPNALVHVHRDDRIGDTPLRDAVGDGKLAMAELLLRYGADPDRPGWMWNSARDDLERLTGEVRTEMESLLGVRPLKKLKDSAHLLEVERQLSDDLEHHGVHGLSIGWRGASTDGTTVQIRGQRLAPFKNLRLTNPDGDVIGRGDFNLLVLTVELDFRIFWTRIEMADVLLTPGGGGIPAHIWERLSPDQRSWLVMDSRNVWWRSKQPGQLRVEGGGW